MLTFIKWFESEIIAVPKVHQQKNWSCGHQSIRAVCKYFDVGPEDEDEYIELLGGSPENGLPPEEIIKFAKKLGFEVHAKTKMSIDELKGFLDKGMPVICAMQAWGTPKNYPKDESGHYVVAVGHAKEKIFFEDPSINKKRGFLKIGEFDCRWHDKDSHGHDCDHMGIVLWHENKPEKHKIDKAKRIK